MQNTDPVIARLMKIRTQEDLTLKPTRYLKQTFTGFDGVEYPLNIRHYQAQMILHLVSMRRFIVGDDAGLGKCVTGDTLIDTDQGLIHIKDLEDWSGMVPDSFKPYTGSAKVLVGERNLPIKNFYYGGVKPTIKITTKHRYSITGSRIHPLLVLRGGEHVWVKTQDLKVGDKLCIDRRGSAFREGKVPFWEDLILKMLVEPDQSKYFKKFADLDNGLNSEILQLPKNTTSFFLQTIFISAQFNKKGIYYPCHNHIVAQQIQILLLKFGIVASLSKPFLNTEGLKTWLLKITKENVLSFQKKIGATTPIAIEAIVKYLKNNKEFKNPEPYLYDPIVSLEEGKAEVFDIEVDDPDHCFIGNGFVNHNTLQSLAALCYLWAKDPAQKVLLLTTKSSAPQWGSEIRKFTSGVTPFVCQGTPKQRAKVREAFEEYSEGPAVLIMGYRTAVQDFRFLQHWSDFIFITDEATAYKNPKSQIHQVCRYLSSQASRVWALTATLIKNNLLEGYGIYSVVMPSVFSRVDDRTGETRPMNYNEFMYYYCQVEMIPLPRSNRRIPKVIGYTSDKVKEFRETIQPYYLGRPKHEVATELPVLVMKSIPVGLSKQQSRKYREAIQGLLTVGTLSGEEEDKEVSKLTAITYCQQIVNHPELIDCEGDSEKLEALKELLTEGDLAGEKVIIFSRFRKMVDIIERDLGLKMVRVTGSESGEQREESKRLFQDPHSGFNIVCITMAGSEAINLQAAKALVFYDSPFSAGDYIQILGRMIRIGSQHDRVFAVHLIAGKNTVDHKVMQILQKKMTLFESVLGQRIKGDNNDSSSFFSTRGDVNELFDLLREESEYDE